jgi:feruloyl esterase
MEVTNVRFTRRLVPLLSVLLPALAGLAGLATGLAGPAAPGTSAAQAAPRSAQSLLAARRASPAIEHPVVRCSQLATPRYDFSDVPDAPAYLLSAVQSGTGQAAVCHISGYLAPQEQFQLALPVSTYTGEYLQSGCGGLCGWSQSVAATTGSASPAAGAGCPTASGVTATSAGQMAGGTDNQGHVGGQHDALWASQDPALRVSFGYTSEHALAQLAKAVITAYYGRPPAYSFYDGCSGGGREALVEAQRYPRDFTGILAGAPGNVETQALGLVPAWVIDVNTGPHGHEILGSEKLPALHAAVIRACGNAQSLIVDPRRCDFDPATLRCPPRAGNVSCLTPAQVRVVRELYRGATDRSGQSLYPGGEPYGSELAWAGVAIDPSTDQNWPADTLAYQTGQSWLRNAAYWHNPPASFRLSDVRFTLAAYRRLLPLAGLYDATDPDLSAFQRAGGKLILWQGWADQQLSPFGTIGYYQAVARAAGGFRASQAFSRLYLIPGQYHCLNGGAPPVNGLTTTNDLMTALIRWTEQGIAPGTFTFPLAHPVGTFRSISVPPVNPLSPPPGGARGLNAHYRWVGRFQPGDELWCATRGMDLICRRRPRPAG